MPDTKPLSMPDLATLHVIAHLRWEREWYETYEIRQAQLLDEIAQLLQQMGETTGDALRFYILGGQTVIVEDVAAVRPDLLALMVIYNAGGRLGLGPWYVQVDQNLVSGESLIRNLLTARVEAAKSGIKLLPIAFSPEQTANVSQLPQILRGFGIGTAMLNTGDPRNNKPYYWKAPDNSSILVLGHDLPNVWVESHTDLMNDSIQMQRALRPDGPFLWLVEHSETDGSASATLNYIHQKTNVPVSQIELVEYLRILRRSLTETLHGMVRGPLLPKSLKAQASGTLSSRLYLKQAHAQVENKLLYAVEPWLALALTHGNLSQPDNPQAMLHHAWRTLHKNQTLYTLGGTSIDAVQTKTENAYHAVDDIAEQIIEKSLNAIEGKVTSRHPSLKPSARKNTTYVVVWNSHNWPIKQAVFVPLTLNQGSYPLRLRIPGDEAEQPFGWQEAEHGALHSGTISFIADAPALGYAVYTLELSDQPVAEHHFIHETKNNTIGNVFGESLTATRNNLNWKREDGTLTDLLRFLDGGDAGDVYHYCPPIEDSIIEGSMVNDVKTISSPVYEQLVINHRMRVANELNDDRTRSRGVRLLELQTTATFYDNIPGVFFRTTFENTAQDHRLRAHLRTGIETKYALTQTAFNFDRVEVGNTYPTQGLTAVHDGVSSLALMSRGLPEVEALTEGDQVTFALTLARSVGWLSRDDLSVREGALAPHLPVPDAQCQRVMSAEYALVATPAGDRAALLRESMIYNSPLQAYQYDVRPSRPRRSFLSILSDQATATETVDSDGAGVILTSFKPPSKGKGWMLHLYNPHDHDVEVFVTPHTRPEQVHLSSLSEDSLKFIETDMNGRVQIAITGNQLVALRLLF
ncbi:MAG: hypothetical protein RLP44_31045 [Aggregatilineales bacterium]